MKNNIFVTGGAGYIGSHACKALKRNGYTPITIDNLVTGWAQSVKYGPLEIVDLLDKKKLSKLFDDYRPLAVMHFAALSQVGESVAKPGLYWRNNVLGSLNLLEVAVAHGCKKMVFSSTCATYGNQDGVILDENSSQHPVNPYGSSKQAVEEIIRNFSDCYDLRYVIFRYFNVAGADPGGEIGEFHKPETHLIPLALDTVVGKRDALTIYGTEYDTPDGTCIRDYVHVSDLIDAHVQGLKLLEAEQKDRVFNLGTGHGFSVREVLDVVESVTDTKIPIILGNPRPGDCAKLVSGSKLAFDELGWQPKRSTIELMVADAWHWHQSGGYSR